MKIVSFLIVLIRKSRSFTLLSLRRLASLFRVVGLKLKGGIDISWKTQVGKGVFIQATNGGRISIGNGTAISSNVQIISQGSSIVIGKNSFIGPSSIIVSKSGITIGNDALIAERVSIRDQDHNIHKSIEYKINQSGFISKPIQIDDDVWIATGAVILKGVIIEKGAVVAANAVVNTNIKSLEIVGGIPAKCIGTRRVNK